jgi:iron complex outermembrane recepter protein
MFHKNKLLTLCLSLSSGVAFAQQTELSQMRLDEIIVTAQKRSENLFDVPIAMSAITPAAMAKNQIKTTQDLQMLVPSLVFTSLASSGTPYLRGIGSDIAQPNAESSVATYIDGVFISLSAVGVQELMAVERVEVLNGPQGTLYGRNAVGGAINVITKSPTDELEGGLEVTLGNFSSTDIEGYVSGPVIDSLSGGIYVKTRSRDSYYDFVGDGQTGQPQDEQTDAARLKLVWEPTDNINIAGTVEYSERENTEGGAYRNVQTNSILFAPPFNQPAIIDDHTVVSDRPQFSKARQTAATLKAELDFDALSVVSITGYRNTDFHLSSDLDGTMMDFIGVEARQSSEQFSEEIQLVSPDDASFDWIIGAYLFNEKTGFFPADTSGGLLLGLLPPVPVFHALTTTPIETDAYALFAQTTFDLSDTMRLTIGGRYSVDEKTLSGAQDVFTDIDGNVLFALPYPDQTEDWDSFTPKITLDYRHQDTLLYATYSEGFKSGAYNAATPSAQLRGPVNPEELSSYEIGSKSEFMDGRLRLETAAYYYEFENLQLQIFDPAVSNSAFLQNAAEAQMYGVDLSITAQVSNQLTLHLGLAWEQGEYDRFPSAVFFNETPFGNLSVSKDISGEDMARVPELVISSSLDYEYPLANGGLINANLGLYYNDGYFFDPAAQLEQDSYEIVNISLGYSFPGDKLTVTAHGNNITDSTYLNSVFYAPTAIVAQTAAPRTYGITLKYDF